MDATDKSTWPSANSGFESPGTINQASAASQTEPRGREASAQGGAAPSTVPPAKSSASSGAIQASSELISVSFVRSREKNGFSRLTSSDPTPRRHMKTLEGMMAAADLGQQVNPVAMAQAVASSQSEINDFGGIKPAEAGQEVNPWCQGLGSSLVPVGEQWLRRHQAWIGLIAADGSAGESSVPRPRLLVTAQSEISYLGGSKRGLG
eukprot:gene2412-8725_t